MSNSTNNSIPYVPQNTLDPAAGLNDAIRVIDSLLNSRVQNLGLTAPPSSPADGQNWIVGSGATGAWAGKDNQLASYVAEGDYWEFYAASQLGLIFNLSDGGVYAWNAALSRYYLVLSNQGAAPVHATDGDLTSGALQLTFNNIRLQLDLSSGAGTISVASISGSQTVDIQRVDINAGLPTQDAWDSYALTTSALEVATGITILSDTLPVALLREGTNVWAIGSFISSSGARASLWARQINFPVQGDETGSSVSSVNLKLPNTAGNVSIEAGDIPYLPESGSGVAGTNLQDAVSELAARTASDIDYDDSESALGATNVQDAIVAVAASAGVVVSNPQTGTAYTLVEDDKGKDVKCTNTHMVTVTIPTSATVSFAPGTILFVSQMGNGSVVVEGEDSSVSLIAPNGALTTGIGDMRALECLETDVWRIL